MKFLFIIDPIETLDPHHDTSLGLMQAAQQRYQSIWITEITDLHIRRGQAFTIASTVQLDLTQTPWQQSQTKNIMALNEFDVIIMRKDPPFNMDYIFATHILDLVSQQGVLVSNHPQSLRDFNEKLILNYFPDLTTDYLVSAQFDQIHQFIQQNKDTVIKPLDSMGGNLISRLQSCDDHRDHILKITDNQKRPVMIMPYIPEVTQGDKRIILLNGKPCDHALLRVPPKGQLLANIAAGGTGQVVPLSKQDYAICQAVAPFCLQHGLQLVGLDVIGPYLTEVNITSPTCLREISDYCQHDYAMDFIVDLEKQLHTTKAN